MAAALGCGLLIGVERERRKGQGPGRAPAGVRSFALASLMGAVCMLMGQLELTLLGAAFIAALGLIAYWRNPSPDPGITTEIALLLAYLIGAVCTWSVLLAAALAVIVTALLAGRERMHHFARIWLQPAELRDGILLWAIALIAVPLLPDRPLWGPVLNPRTIATLLTVLLAIQALAHLCRRLLLARNALMLSALASGFVSSTATIGSLGMEVRAGKTPARVAAGGALMSCVATLLQLLAVAATVQPTWLGALWLPALVGSAVAAAWAAVLMRGSVALPESAPSEDAQRMFSLSAAALVALALTGVQAAVYALSLWLGHAGLFVGTWLAATVELHAAVTAVLAQAPQADPPTLIAVSVALAVHGLSRCVVAWASGGRAYALALAPGLLGHTVVVVGMLAGQIL